MINVTLEVIRLSHEAPQLPILENPRQSFASFSPISISTLGVSQLIFTFSMRLSPDFPVNTASSVSIEYVMRLGCWSHHILTCLVAFFFFLFFYSQFNFSKLGYFASGKCSVNKLVNKNKDHI